MEFKDMIQLFPERDEDIRRAYQEIARKKPDKSKSREHSKKRVEDRKESETYITTNSTNYTSENLDCS